MGYVRSVINIFVNISIEDSILTLKMLGLYLYTLIIGNKSGNILSILNKLKLLKELQTFVTNNVFSQKSKNSTTTKQKFKHKNPCRSWGLNTGPLAPKANALPLHHRFN